MQNRKGRPKTPWVPEHKASYLMNLISKRDDLYKEAKFMRQRIAEEIIRLKEEEHFSNYQIASMLGISPQRVGEMTKVSDQVKNFDA